MAEDEALTNQRIVWVPDTMAALAIRERLADHRARHGLPWGEGPIVRVRRGPVRDWVTEQAVAWQTVTIRIPLPVRWVLLWLFGEL